MNERMMLMERARLLRAKMRQLGPLLKGTVLERQMHCGKEGCRCMRGHPHEYMVITWKESGKSRMVYVDESRRKDALAWNSNYRKFKDLLSKETQVLIRLLKRKKETTKKRSAAWINKQTIMKKSKK